MAKGTRHFMVVTATSGLLLSAQAVPAQDAPPHVTGGLTAGSVHRIRTDNALLRELVRDARERSATFRRLTDEIQATDGIVYLERMKCGRHVRACLAHAVTVVGPNRVLRVMVSPTELGIDAIALMAHELRHAMEVLSDPTVRSRPAMFFLYQRIGSWRGSAFETEAAIATELAVRREMRE